MTDRPIPPMYFSLGTTQPFADMSLRDVEGEEGVQLTIADGKVVGLFLPDVRMLQRLEEICEKAGIDPYECWRRVRGDVDLSIKIREKVR
jgi:AMMECR1 domain-containing protein